MYILVSFCNTRAQGLPALGLLDPLKSKGWAFQFPDILNPPQNFTGLTASEQYVYAVSQRLSAPSLLIFDRCDLKLLNRYTFQIACDVHSILLVGDSLFVVSTGTDEVIELRMRDTECVSEKIFWRPEPIRAYGRREDTFHFNGICQSGTGLFISGFGKRRGGLWDSSTDGFVFDISRGEIVASGINQPHSLAEVDGKLVLCESGRRAVRTLEGPCIEALPGYARGICVVGRKLFVATSVQRRVSRSSGTALTPSFGPGEPEGRCSICRISIDDWQLEEIIELPIEDSEIYDLLAIEGIDDRALLTGGTGWHQSQALILEHGSEREQRC